MLCNHCADECILWCCASSFAPLHYRYGPGQRFGKHVDDSVNLGGCINTEYTLLIYLTSSSSIAASKTKGRSSVQGKDSSVLVGGETKFYGRHSGTVSCMYTHVAFTYGVLQKTCSSIYASNEFSTFTDNNFVTCTKC